MSAIVDAAAADDGLGVLRAMRDLLAAAMDDPGSTMILPQIAGRLQAVNREIDERLGAVEPRTTKPGLKPAEPAEDDDNDELARLRRRMLGRGAG